MSSQSTETPNSGLIAKNTLAPASFAPRSSADRCPELCQYDEQTPPVSDQIREAPWLPQEVQGEVGAARAMLFGRAFEKPTFTSHFLSQQPRHDLRANEEFGGPLRVLS